MFIVIDMRVKNWEEVSNYIKEARKDPEFRKDLKNFIAIAEGRKRKSK